MYALIDHLTHPQHSRSALLRCAVLAYWFDNGFSRMLVRVPVHGMRGVLESRMKSKSSFVIRIYRTPGSSAKHRVARKREEDQKNYHCHPRLCTV